MLSPQTLPAIQAALREQRLDGWLLFDFQGLNPVARGMLGFDGLLSRRAFALVPLEGTPVAISHAIEQGPWKRWPDEWPRERHRFVVRRSLFLTHRVGVALDLQVNGVAEAETLVPQLVHEFGVQLLGRVDITDGFEEAEREQGVDGREHPRKVTSCNAVFQRANLVT